MLCSALLCRRCSHVAHEYLNVFCQLIYDTLPHCAGMGSARRRRRCTLLKTIKHLRRCPLRSIAVFFIIFSPVPLRLLLPPLSLPRLFSCCSAWSRFRCAGKAQAMRQARAKYKSCGHLRYPIPPSSSSDSDSDSEQRDGSDNKHDNAAVATALAHSGARVI